MVYYILVGIFSSNLLYHKKDCFPTLLRVVAVFFIARFFTAPFSGRCKMRTETAGVTETLIESAKKEFLEHGFQNANLRRISSESGVSTGSIYTRFGDKAGLFSAVVKPAADGLMELYLESITAARESGTLRRRQVRAMRELSLC